MLFCRSKLLKYKYLRLIQDCSMRLGWKNRILDTRCLILDAGLINSNLLFYPVSRNQYPVSCIYCNLKSFIVQTAATNYRYDVTKCLKS